jgi:pimeloyl-ACP methyl ester carboxylesterase
MTILTAVLEALALAYALNVLVMIVFIIWQIGRGYSLQTLQQPQNRLAGTGVTFREVREEPGYTIIHIVEDGIERIVYTPTARRHETPVLLAHGMWHGAWCWEPWQKALAEKGWESVAYSLPGHGRSPVQRPIFACTLDYYLAFLRDEVNRLPRKPVLIGHSMGGALTQWYLKHIGDDLPAAVLAAPWTSHNAYRDSLPSVARLDLLGAVLMTFTWDARPLMRNPRVAARALLSPQAEVSPDDLFAKLGSEAGLVMMMHNPPGWHPRENLRTPMLLLAGQADALIPLDALRRSAEFYRAQFVIVPGAGHNLMMESSQRQTVESICGWLEQQAIA